MLPEFILTLRPNNQISIALQNVIQTAKKVAQSCENSDFLPDVSTPLKKALYKAKLHGCTAKNSPLDIIQKSQHRLGTLSEAGFRIRAFWHTDHVFGLWHALVMRHHRVVAYRLFWCIIRLLVVRGQYCLNKPRQFGHRSAQKILESGAIVERLCGKRPEFAHCTTLTLPANYWQAFECLAARTSDVVNRLFQIFRRRYKDTKLWFFVWEFQKRGALHLHICHYHPDTAEGQWIGTQLIEQWHKILDHVSRESGVCLFSRKKGTSCTIRQNHQHHTQPMEKGCGRYFAKYAMKATKNKENDYFHRFSKILAPTSFWGSSRSIKDSIRESSIELRCYATDRSPERIFKQIEDELMEMEVTSFSEYEWKIEIEKATIPTYSKLPSGRKMLRAEVEGLVVSEGLRKTFYVSSDCYYKYFESLSMRSSQQSSIA